MCKKKMCKKNTRNKVVGIKCMYNHEAVHCI